MKKVKIILSGLFILLFIISAMDGAATGSETNQAYWVEASGNSRIDQIVLSMGEERTIRLIAEVPEGETLKAYSISLSYNNTKISVEKAVASPGSSLPPLNINRNIPGSIIMNAFDVIGISGPAVISFIDITLKGLVPGSFDGVVHFDSYGASEEIQFRPVIDAFSIVVQ